MLYRKLAFGAILCTSKLISQDDRIYVSQSTESSLKVFSGLSHRDLSSEVAGHLGVQLGRVSISHFPDGETKVRVLDDVSDQDVFVIQSITPPVNDSLVELLFLISSLRTAHCRRVVAVIPYLAYTERDQKTTESDAILGADLARMLELMGADAIVSIDFHSPYVKGFFTKPTINLTALPLAAQYFARKQLVNPLILSPTFSGLIRAHAFRKEMLNLGINCDIGVLPDEVSGTAVTQYKSFGILPKDLKNRDVVIINDAVETGRSCVNAVHLLRTQDVDRIFMFATHGLLRGSALEEINATSLSELVLTNTLPLPQETRKVRQLSVARLLAEAIRRTLTHEMISEYTKQ